MQKEGTVFQRLREWYLDAEQKRGAHRRDLDVTTCFGPLLGWIIRRWGGKDERLALALDTTTLANRWTVLAVRVLARGCAIPVGRIGGAQPSQRVVASLLGAVVRPGERSCPSLLPNLTRQRQREQRRAYKRRRKATGRYPSAA